MIVQNAHELHMLLKESVILEECLLGKFSFFMFENTSFLYKIRFLKNNKNPEKNGVNTKMKVIFGVNQRGIKADKGFLEYFIKIIMINMFEVLTFKESKYYVAPTNIIMEIESDNSENKIY